MKIDTLEPEFKEVVEKVIEEVSRVTGRRWVVTDGRRTLAEQASLYAQGRSTPGKIVTCARPGFSPHNYGLGVDLAPMTTNGKQIDWAAPRPLWKALADAARAHGLTPGFYFKSIFDAPHIEDPRWKEQRALWQAGKLKVS